MNDFRKLDVWCKSIDLVEAVYRTTCSFPESEKLNLISQINRAAISIPSNIAEGCGRQTDTSFHYFLSIALGSAYELETQFILSKRLGYLSEESFQKIQNNLVEIQKMIAGLMRKLSAKPS